MCNRVLFIYLLFVFSAKATLYAWKTATSGNWEGDNWNILGYPSKSTDIANISANRAGEYTVTIQRDVYISKLIIGYDTPNTATICPYFVNVLVEKSELKLDSLIINRYGAITLNNASLVVNYAAIFGGIYGNGRITVDTIEGGIRLGPSDSNLVYGTLEFPSGEFGSRGLSLYVDLDLIEIDKSDRVIFGPTFNERRQILKEDSSITMFVQSTYVAGRAPPLIDTPYPLFSYRTGGKVVDNGNYAFQNRLGVCYPNTTVREFHTLNHGGGYCSYFQQYDVLFGSSSCGRSESDCEEYSYCNNHGTCQNGACQCNQGWEGNDCREPACPVVNGAKCSGHGICIAGPQCVCSTSESGYWMGENCETMVCPNNCSGNGNCTTNGNQVSCQCSIGYSGNDCSNISSSCPVGNNNLNCSGHGICKDNGTIYWCECNSDFGATACSIPLCAQVKGCNGRGSCVTSEGDSNICQCDSNWKGEDCLTPSCAFDCNGGGLCTSRNGAFSECVCLPGYSGTSCLKVAEYESDSSVPIFWVGIAVGVVVVAAAVVASILYWSRRRERIKENSDLKLETSETSK